MEPLRKRRPAEFKLVRKIPKLKLIVLGDRRALKPIAAGPIGIAFPTVTVAEFAIALHRHRHPIGGEFHPDQPQLLRITLSRIGFAHFRFREHEVITIVGVLVDCRDGFNGGPDGHIAGHDGQTNGAAEMGEHGVKGLGVGGIGGMILGG